MASSSEISEVTHLSKINQASLLFPRAKKTIHTIYTIRNEFVHSSVATSSTFGEFLIEVENYIYIYIYIYIRECGSTLYVGMTRTAARAAYRLILK